MTAARATIAMEDLMMGIAEASIDVMLVTDAE